MDIMTDGPTLVLSGDFDVRSTWEVRQAIYDHLEGHDHDVVVDLSDVDTCDVTALKVTPPPSGCFRLRPARPAGRADTSRCVAAGRPCVACSTSPT